jgi:LmbE family N-acetylglucosaminyl deacetylase
VATVAFVHAHPDDEAIFSGGTIPALVQAGHRVVLVVATGGELGLAPDETATASHVAAHRRAESDAAAALLGIDALYFMGHHDSGMAGDPANDVPGSFWSADPDGAARDLAAVLRGESADSVVVYDRIGIYGHPDHVRRTRSGSPRRSSKGSRASTR